MRAASIRQATSSSLMAWLCDDCSRLSGDSRTPPCRGTLGVATLPLLTPQSPEALLLLESTRIVLPACQATGEGLGHAPFRVRDAARERIFFCSRTHRPGTISWNALRALSVKSPISADVLCTQVLPFAFRMRTRTGMSCSA